MSDNKNITDAELDALFKNADAAGSVPAFDEAFWTEMEGMLPAKKRFGAIFWWTSGAALVAGLAILIGVTQFDTEVSMARGGGYNPSLIENQNDPALGENNSEKTSNDVNNQNKAIWNQSDDAYSGNQPISTDETTNPKVETPKVNGTQIDVPNTKGNDQKPELTQNVADKANVNAESNTTADADLQKKGFVFTRPVVLNDVYVDRSAKNRIPLFTEFAVGYGQSYKRIDFSNNWATQFRFTIGLTKEVPGMQLSAGLALRAEMPNNLSYVKTEGSNGATTSTVNEYRGLYSVEFPMEAAGKFGRNSLGLVFVPGIQLGYTGNRSYYQNTNLVSRERSGGALESAKTMTMECGVKYAYDISERLQFTGSCTFDMVRPFQSTYYQGDNQDYPIAFFVGLRKKF